MPRPTYKHRMTEREESHVALHQDKLRLGIVNCKVITVEALAPRPSGVVTRDNFTTSQPSEKRTKSYFAL